MPTGVVEFIGKSRSGKPTVTIGGQIYSASKVDLTGLKVSDFIEFDSASGVFNNATIWFLNAWKPAPASTQPPQKIAAPTAPSAAHNRTLGVTEGERAFISNCVASAIAAGKIEGPADITSWANGALHAIRGAGNPDYVPF